MRYHMVYEHNIKPEFFLLEYIFDLCAEATPSSFDFRSYHVVEELLLPHNLHAYKKALTDIKLKEHIQRIRSEILKIKDVNITEINTKFRSIFRDPTKTSIVVIYSVIYIKADVAFSKRSPTIL